MQKSLEIFQVILINMPCCVPPWTQAGHTTAVPRYKVTPAPLLCFGVFTHENQQACSSVTNCISPTRQHLLVQLPHLPCERPLQL